MKEQHADQFKKLDVIEKTIADAIIQQKDIFDAFHIQLHQNTQDAIKHEHGKTRQVIIDTSEKRIQGRFINSSQHNANI